MERDLLWRLQTCGNTHTRVHCLHTHMPINSTLCQTLVSRCFKEEVQQMTGKQLVLHLSDGTTIMWASVFAGVTVSFCCSLHTCTPFLWNHLPAMFPYPFPSGQCGVSPHEWLALGSHVLSESVSSSSRWVHLQYARAGSRTRFLFGSPRAENKAPTDAFRGVRLPAIFTGTRS